MWDLFFFFKQKTAYEMRISDWSSDVCSSDLKPPAARRRRPGAQAFQNMRAAPDAAIADDLDFSTHRVDNLAQLIERRAAAIEQIGRASCGERVGQYVEIAVVAGSLKKKSRTDPEIRQEKST